MSPRQLSLLHLRSCSAMRLGLTSVEWRSRSSRMMRKTISVVTNCRDFWRRLRLRNRVPLLPRDGLGEGTRRGRDGSVDEMVPTVLRVILHRHHHWERHQLGNLLEVVPFIAFPFGWRDFFFRAIAVVRHRTNMTSRRTYLQQ